MRRLIAVFVLLTAALGSSLTGASAAHAEASDPVCRMTSLNTLDVICTVPPEADGLRIDFIQWTRNGGNLPQLDNIRQIRVSCSPGETFTIGVRIGFDGIGDEDPPGLIEGSTRFTCREPLKITYFLCESLGDLDGYAPFSCACTGKAAPDPTRSR